MKSKSDCPSSSKRAATREWGAAHGKGEPKSCDCRELLGCGHPRACVAPKLPGQVLEGCLACAREQRAVEDALAKWQGRFEDLENYLRRLPTDKIGEVIMEGHPRRMLQIISADQHEGRFRITVQDVAHCSVCAIERGEG